MVVDASRIPAVGTSRSRLVRPATFTQIPSPVERRASPVPTTTPASTNLLTSPSLSTPPRRLSRRIANERSSISPSHSHRSMTPFSTKRHPTTTVNSRRSSHDTSLFTQGHNPTQPDRSDAPPIRNNSAQSRALRASVNNNSRLSTSIPTPRRQMASAAPPASPQVRKVSKGALNMSSPTKNTAPAPPVATAHVRQREERLSSSHYYGPSENSWTSTRNPAQATRSENRHPGKSLDTELTPSGPSTLQISTSTAPNGRLSLSKVSSSRLSRASLPDGKSAHSVRHTATLKHPRSTLQQSPYVRRSSVGGTSSRSASISNLKREPVVDAGKNDIRSASTTPRTSNVSMSSPVRQKSSSYALDRSVESIEGRGSGVVGVQTRRGSNVAESFRGYRHLSLDNTASIRSSYPKETPQSPLSTALEQLDRELMASAKFESLCAIRRASVDNELVEQELQIPQDVQPPFDCDPDTGSGNKSASKNSQLPDRVDAIVPAVQSTSTPNTTPSRKPMRFSDAAVYLGDVDRMRDSLGSRRSVDLNDPHFDPETPRLRRSSIGFGGIVFGAYEDPTDHRPPLTSITINQGNVVPVDPVLNTNSFVMDPAHRNKPCQSESDDAPKTLNLVPELDDDHLDLGFDEDVEDLSA